MALLSLTAVSMSGDPVTAKAHGRLRSAQQRAVQQFHALAMGLRVRVPLDAEGLPIIPGRYGQIEWYCDGANCAAAFGGFCPLPGKLALAIYTGRPRLFEKLWAIAGVTRHQTGDREMRAVFPPEALDQVGAVIRARRRRTLAADEARRRGFKSTHRATSGP